MIPKYQYEGRPWRNDMEYVKVPFLHDYMDRADMLEFFNTVYEGITFYFIDNEALTDQSHGIWAVLI